MVAINSDVNTSGSYSYMYMFRVYALCLEHSQKYYINNCDRVCKN